jgi:gas vesicle protein
MKGLLITTAIVGAAAAGLYFYLQSTEEGRETLKDLSDKGRDAFDKAKEGFEDWRKKADNAMQDLA